MKQNGTDQRWHLGATHRRDESDLIRASCVKCELAPARRWTVTGIAPVAVCNFRSSNSVSATGAHRFTPPEKYLLIVGVKSCGPASTLSALASSPAGP
jgi:hypothetical protein